MELAEIILRIAATAPKAMVPIEESVDYIQVESKHWLKVANLLRNDPDLHFDSMMCITGIDDGPEGQLWAAYNLHSMDKLHKLEVRIYADRKKPKIPSVANIWRTADWHEREAYDLIGIEFEGHPDFRRILLPFDWEGHPLQKDFETPDYYRGMPVPKDKRGWE